MSTTNHYKNVQRTVRPFFSITNTEGRPGLNVLFTDDGLVDMVQAADIKKMYMITLFIGTLFYVISCESEICLVKNVAKEYVDVTNKICGHRVLEKWTAANITRLRRVIEQSKVNEVTLCSSYKNSEKETVK